MARPTWFVNLLKWLYPTRHIFAKMTRLPVIGPMVDFFLFRDDRIIYLPQDHTIAIHADIEEGSSMVLPSQAVDYFIEQASHHWIMDFCICREGDGCRDYPRELGCIFLGESVTKINSDMGRKVTKEEALKHAQRCREAGLVHTIGRSRLDAAWLGAFPSQKLMTICNCCPCCCLWGLAPHLAPTIGDKITKMPGVQVSITERCTGCGECLSGICTMKALEQGDGKIFINGACRGCGRCVDICPHEAIELTIRGANSLQETIAQISPLVDLA